MASSSAQRMRELRQRRRADNLREIRLVVPDLRSPEVRRQIAEEFASLDPKAEAEALAWIEAVSEFDEPTPR
jgi:hypothetical protein